MKAILLTLILILSFNSHAENVPLPVSITSIDDMVDEFRNILTTKLADLSKNYIALQSDKTIALKSNSDVKCNKENASSGETLTTFQYITQKNPNELVEKVIYSGCKNQVSLVEDVISRGEHLTELSFEDFAKGKRVFDLRVGETYRLYRISNANNEEIFKLLVEKKDKSKLVEFSFLGQVFLRLNFDYQDLSTRLFQTFLGYKGRYSVGGSTWEYNTEIDTFTNSILARAGKIVNVSFFDSVGSPVSENDFNANFDHWITNKAFTRIRQILEFHTSFFPPTVQVQNGSANQRLKQELRQMFNRLQNNTDLPLVKLQVQDYIDAAEKNLLIDTRPKQ